MSETPLLRSRRSKSGTPLTPSSVVYTPTRNGFLHHPGAGGDKKAIKVSPLTNDSLVVEADASFRTEDKVSPMLAKLRMTPGRLLKEKQSLLVRKHEESRRKLDSINVGGGVSLWPEMDSMRLTGRDVWRLCGTCLLLCSVVTALFYILHGSAISELLRFHKVLTRFAKKHPIEITKGQENLDESVILWHSNFKEIVGNIRATFAMKELPTSYLLYMLVYATTVIVLFFYLIDNMLAKSKLSPRRIRRWVSLLVLTGTWTTLMVLTLGVALRTEAAVEMNIHSLADAMAEAIPTGLSCDRLSWALQYWHLRCLPPTTHGTVAVFGLVPARDLLYYLQYYSLPVGTVLLTPVFKLIVSVMTVYNIGQQKT